ncbi:MAG: FAD-dependent oxidoreductase [Planctomycetota bacterium]
MDPQKKQDCQNLLVPVCVSSTHTAFGSIRMEPVFMILGQSAATAACMAIDNNQAVQSVDYSKLRAKLEADNQICELTADQRETLKQKKLARATRHVDPRSLDGVVIDEPQAGLDLGWVRSQSSNRFIGKQYYHDDQRSDGKLFATFRHTVSSDGDYQINLLYPPNPNRATNTPVVIAVDKLVQTRKVNQRVTSGDLRLTSELGTFKANSGQEISVTITNSDTDGYVIVDAIQIIRK